MSNGDDESADAPEDADDSGEVPATEVTAESLGERLDDAEAALEDAETEAALDEIGRAHV